MNTTINNQLDEHALKMALQRASKSFSQASFLPHEVGKRLLERLSCLRVSPQVIVDCATKDGFMSEQLLMLYPNSTIISQEQIPDFFLQPMENGLLKSQRSQRYELVSSHKQMPFESDCIDLLICNLYLHLANDLKACFEEFYRILKPNGVFFFTMYGPDTLQELKASFKSVSKYEHVHEFIDMHDIGDLLLQQHFIDPVMDMEHLTVQYDSPSALMTDLKYMAATNIRNDRHRGLLGKKRWQKLIKTYNAFRANQRIPATFEIIYGHGRIPSQKKQGYYAEDNEFVIPLTRVRARGER